MNTPSLPPGQRPAEHRPFGLPQFGPVVPQLPRDAVVTVTGAVRRPGQIPVAELGSLPGRTGRVADLHCVTTWSALGLSWSGGRSPTSTRIWPSACNGGRPRGG